ncbi:uncharacterized protein SCHCODRAFT_01338102, partial [Schizophyllum commune H4-8]|uniref:uncharacterized protein n=1 Tax=Schizophyllum commune (strain H4-8 / FGSC 9210) TaxID=578458 RepID=UPI00215DF03A
LPSAFHCTLRSAHLGHSSRLLHYLSSRLPVIPSLYACPPPAPPSALWLRASPSSSSASLPTPHRCIDRRAAATPRATKANDNGKIAPNPLLRPRYPSRRATLAQNSRVPNAVLNFHPTKRDVLRMIVPHVFLESAPARSVLVRQAGCPLEAHPGYSH